MAEAKRGGIMTEFGYCKEGLTPRTNRGLTSCARKQALAKLTATCSRYYGGKGVLDPKDLEKGEKPKCGTEYNLFPPHDDYCSIEITAKCLPGSTADTPSGATPASSEADAGAPDGGAQGGV